MSSDNLSKKRSSSNEALSRGRKSEDVEGDDDEKNLSSEPPPPTNSPEILEATEKMENVMDELETIVDSVMASIPLRVFAKLEDSQEEQIPQPAASASRSLPGIHKDHSSKPNDGTLSDTGCPSSGNTNHNCMALLPLATKTSQMIPIAVLRKASNAAVEENNGGNCGTGLMQLLTGKSSKVAPALASNANSETTVGAAVLMLIPKKSEAICLENQQDQENNPAKPQENQESPSEAVTVKPTPSYDSYEEVCRICHDNPSKLELISPCLCKGSMSKVHRTCLERWLGESAKNSCEICGYEYNTVRKPKYTGCRSVYQWIRHPLSPSDTRNLFFDIACFFILTPLAAISSWLCVVGAQHYTFGEERRRRTKFHDPNWEMSGRNDPRADASNATWTSVGLLSLTGTLLVAYSVWLFVAIKYHIQAWRDWQQRNFTVTIVPFEDGCMGRPPPPRPPRPVQSTPVGNNNVQLGERSNSINNNNNTNNSPYNFFGSTGFNYDLGASSYLRYTGHSAVTSRGRGGRIARNNRRHRTRETYLNLPPIFSRSHFLRNPPPGYTISETALLYQALYGNDSDSYLNENFLAFFADSSEEITETSSMMLSANPQAILNGSGTEATGPIFPMLHENTPEVKVTRSTFGLDNTEQCSSSKDNAPQQRANNNKEELTRESQKGSSSTEPQSKKSTAPGTGNNDTVITIENSEETNKNDLNREDIV